VHVAVKWTAPHGSVFYLLSFLGFCAESAHEPLPVGETGGSKGMGGGREGDHPPVGPRGTSGSASRGDGGEDRGYPASGRLACGPFPARGAEPHSNSVNERLAPQGVNICARDESP
jgi:hypothetical protein